MKKLNVTCECCETPSIDQLIDILAGKPGLVSGEFFKSSNVDPEAEPTPEDLEFLGESQADRDAEEAETE